MLPLMKFHSLWRLNIVQTISHCESLKYSSTHALKLEEINITKKYSVQNKKKRNVFTPFLAQDKLEMLNDFTSITLATNYVSWAKISISNSTLTEWNACQVPLISINNMNEIEVLKTAKTVKQIIPNSDLYVMESARKWRLGLNEIFFRTALIMLINNFEKDSEDYDKVVIQDYYVLNTLHDLEIGCERKSAKEVVEKIFKLHNRQNDTVNDESDRNSSINISTQQKQFFTVSERTKQESLSLALLIAFSFWDVLIFRNPKSKEKLMKKFGSKIRSKT